MNILVVGANSAIARATARLYAKRGDELFLIGRDPERLSELSADLNIRGAARVAKYSIDVTQYDQLHQAIESVNQFFDRIDLALICHGSLPDQNTCDADFRTAQRHINVNGISVIAILIELTKLFQQQRKGTIAVITSVAGDRGRQSNYLYGATKALVSTYLQGLRGRLFPEGIHVVDIRPGLVDTPMTSHLEKGPLFSSPERIASCIVSAIDRKKPIVYAPAYWRVIMTVVCSIPEIIFKRLKF